MPGEDGAVAPVDSVGSLALATGDALPGVVTMILPFHVEGDARIVEFAVVPLGTDDGAYLVGVREALGRAADDVTRMYLAAFLETTDAAVVGARSDGTILHVNAAAERLFGFGAGEAAGRNVRDLVAEERRDEYEQVMTAVAGGDRIYGLDTLGVATSGETLEVSVSVAPIRGASGAVVGSIALLRDVGEHREADRLARLYFELAETSPIGISLWRRSSIGGGLELVAANALARDMTGLTTASVGRTSNELAATCPALERLEWTDAPAGSAPLFELGAHLMVGANGRQRVIDLETFRVGQDVLALRMTDVTEDVRARRDRQHLLRRVADAEDAERRRIAEALHDDTIQILAAVNMELGSLRRRAADRDLAARVERVEHRVRQATHALRSLVFELYPPDLESGGLVVALPALADRVFENTEVRTTIVNGLHHRTGTEVRIAAYRIVQEALANVRRHARASSVRITLAHDGETFVATVTDDGRGFDESAAERIPGHLGLRTMRERAEAIQGSFALRPAAPTGVEIEIRLPDPDLAAADEL